MGRYSVSKTNKAKGRDKCDTDGFARPVLNLFLQEFGILRPCWLPLLCVCRVLVTDGRYDKNHVQFKIWWELRADTLVDGC